MDEHPNEKPAPSAAERNRSERKDGATERPAPQSHNDGKEYGTAKRPAGGAHADPHGHKGPG